MVISCLCPLIFSLCSPKFTHPVSHLFYTCKNKEYLFYKYSNGQWFYYRKKWILLTVITLAVGSLAVSVFQQRHLDWLYFFLKSYYSALFLKFHIIINFGTHWISRNMEIFSKEISGKWNIFEYLLAHFV